MIFANVKEIFNIVLKFNHCVNETIKECVEIRNVVTASFAPFGKSFVEVDFIVIKWIAFCKLKLYKEIFANFIHKNVTLDNIFFKNL